MRINIREEFRKLLNQKEFMLLLISFLIIFSLLNFNKINSNNNPNINNVNNVNDTAQINNYINNYKDDLKKSVQTLRDKTNSPQIRFNELLKNSINRQADAYEKLSNENLILRHSKNNGVLYLNDTIGIDNLLIALSFFIGFLIFNFDRKYKTNSFISTIKNGRHNKAFSKISLYILIIFVITIFSYILYLILVSRFIGFGDIGLNIQSYEVFRDATLNINIIQYILFFLLQKIITIIFVISIFSLIFSLFKDNRIQVLVAIFFIGISYILNNNISNNSIFEFVKATSIYSMLDVFSIYGKYSDVYLFFIFLDTNMYIMIFSISMIISTLIISYIINKNEILDSKTAYRLNLINKLKAKSLFVNEFIRFIFDSKGLISIILLVLIATNQYPSKEREKYDFFRFSYVTSLNEFKGEINQNMLERLELKKEYYNSLEKKAEEIKEQYNQGKINYQERNIQLSNIESESAKKHGFDKIFKQVNTANKNVNKSDNLYLIDEKISEYNFQYNDYNLMFSGIFYLILIFVISEVFLKDDSLKMNGLIKSTKNGHIKLLKNRIIISIFYSILIFSITLMVLYIYSKVGDFGINLSYVVQSYTDLVNLPSIRLFYIFIFYLIYGIVNIIFIVNFIIYINLKINNKIVIYAVLLSLSVLPIVFSIISNNINILTLNIFSNIFTIIFSLYQYGIYGIFAEFMLLIILSIILIKQNKHQWQSKINN